jgi:hypothetical protein
MLPQASSSTGTALHLPAGEHCLHAARHELSQHTPSVQKPRAHSASFEPLVPTGLGGAPPPPAIPIFPAEPIKPPVPPFAVPPLSALVPPLPAPPPGAPATAAPPPSPTFVAPALAPPDPLVASAPAPPTTGVSPPTPSLAPVLAEPAAPSWCAAEPAAPLVPALGCGTVFESPALLLGSNKLELVLPHAESQHSTLIARTPPPKTRRLVTLYLDCGRATRPPLP